MIFSVQKNLGLLSAERATAAAYPPESPCRERPLNRQIIHIHTLRGLNQLVDLLFLRARYRESPGQRCTRSS
jgi:hypothetical protein